MPAVPSPTARGRRLRHELRRLREEAGLTHSEVARRLDWSASKLSRIETGHLHVIHRGVYAVGRRKLAERGRWMAAVLACGPGAVLSLRGTFTQTSAATLAVAIGGSAIHCMTGIVQPEQRPAPGARSTRSDPSAGRVGALQ